MKMNAFLTSSLLFFAMASQAQSMANGTVYLDQNQNGKMDRNEKGVAGVSVSNGRDVTLTDEKGRYQLAVGNDNVLFVIKPSGFQFLLDDNNLPKSYYIHKPIGSPKELKYPATNPTGAIPKVLNFGLIKQAEDNKFTMLVFGDPQAYTAQEMTFFNRAIVDEVVGIKNVAFGISLGDLVGDDLSLHPSYKQSIARIGIPWYNLKGNHDMNLDVSIDSLSDETFEANFGPANYSFNYGKVHFIVLDNVRYPNPKTGKGYIGGLHEDQFQFIANDLKQVAKDHLVVLAFHIPLNRSYGDTFRLNDRKRLFELLKPFPHTLSLSAHMHTQTQHFYAEEADWHQEKPHHEYNAGTTSGDWYSGQLDARAVPVATMRDGTPNGYAFIDFDHANYKIRYQASGRDSSYQINIFHPKVVGQGKGSRAAIYANFFMGHHGNNVEYSINQGEWKKMNPIQSSDPAYQAALYPWDNLDSLLAGRRPTDAVISSHLWRVALPINLPIGTHEIRVRATDDYGKEYQASSQYRIEASKPYPDLKQ